MKIGDVASKRKPLAIPFENGPVLNVFYNAALYTPEYEQKMRKAGKVKEGDEEDEDTNSEALSNMVIDLVTEWDLEEDDSTQENPKIIPLKVQRLNKIPIVVLSRIIRAITDDLFPNPSRSTPSGSFS